MKLTKLAILILGLLMSISYSSIAQEYIKDSVKINWKKDQVSLDFNQSILVIKYGKNNTKVKYVNYADSGRSFTKKYSHSEGTDKGVKVGEVMYRINYGKVSNAYLLLFFTDEKGDFILSRIASNRSTKATIVEYFHEGKKVQWSSSKGFLN